MLDQQFCMKSSLILHKKIHHHQQKKTKQNKTHYKVQMFSYIRKKNIVYVVYLNKTYGIHFSHFNAFLDIP